MNKNDKRVIAEIQTEANMKFDDELFIEKPLGDHIKKFIDSVNRITDDGWEPFFEAHPEISKEEIAEWKERVNSGEIAGLLEGSEKTIDDKVAKKKEKWVEKQIDKAIKEGRLTNPNKDPLIKKAKQKLRRHERRNQKGKEGSDK